MGARRILSSTQQLTFSTDNFLIKNTVSLFLVLLGCSTFVNLACAFPEHHHYHDGESDSEIAKECTIVFENEDMRTRVRDECNKTNPIDESKIIESYPVHSTLDAFDYDDNCFAGCVYKAESLMSEDGILNKDEVQHFFKSNMTSSLYSKLTALFYACIDTTNRIAEKKEMNPCKKASLHEFCVVKGIVASAHELMKMEC